MGTAVREFAKIPILRSGYLALLKSTTKLWEVSPTPMDERN